jgi:tRNA wybutosine-synthesizing protein 4
MGTHKPKAGEDERIIGTNDYSIVSKRSVEKLYLSGEPEFLRPFVTKFKRRAPLINRGYWLRMRVIEHVVRQFLECPIDVSKSKVVINLGCGYDPLPFRMRWKYPELCENVKFIDIDYPQLIEKKLRVLSQENISAPSILFNDHYNNRGLDESGSAIPFDSEHYCLVGCDLERLNLLQDIFSKQIHLDDYMVLFVAEVSITYMDTTAADDLIRWASHFSNSRFCLLEQILPDGPDHPFAKTMLDHFAKQAPLKSIFKYPSLSCQRERFIKGGWTKAYARNLWTIWQDPMFLTDDDRIALDSVEPFDEWEELALFAGHYFLLVAGSKSASDVERNLAVTGCHTDLEFGQQQSALFAQVEYNNLPRGQGQRRFGATAKIDAHVVLFHGGQTSTSRQKCMDIYTNSPHQITCPEPPEVLACHTITVIEQRVLLLVGGRTSPAKASSKCWVQENGAWNRADDLSPGRYRHCATSVCSDHGRVLVFGGKTSGGEVLDSWTLWSVELGWMPVIVSGTRPEARFGANLIATGNDRGLLFGGMNKAGIVLTDIWEWEFRQTTRPEIHCKEANIPFADAQLVLCRFGAISTSSRWGSLLIGGISSYGVVDRFTEAVLVGDDKSVTCLKLFERSSFPRPLLVGAGISRVEDDNLLIVGGGAVCFSFGAFWNDNYYNIYSQETTETYDHWHWASREMTNQDANHLDRKFGSNRFDDAKPRRKLQQNHHEESEVATFIASPIQTTKLAASSDFDTILESGQPVVIRGADLGRCTTLWTDEYLAEKIGPNRNVTIHRSNTSNLSFRSKNFVYEVQPFGHFMADLANGKHVYMRAISSSQPGKLPTNLERDFPKIAVDFCLPESMRFAQDHMHSSVLRVSGNIKMWLHYDVMANILCQIRGSKRVILFPPTDVSKLRFSPGETTSDLDVFDGVEKLDGTHPVETVLKEREVLLIPACWPHATAPAKDGGLSVAVNVFFRSLKEGYAAGRDVYGNRDLTVYESGRKDLAKVIESLKDLDWDKKISLAARLTGILRGEKMEHCHIDKIAERGIAKIRRRLERLPADIDKFYSLRLADELSCQLVQSDQCG